MCDHTSLPSHPLSIQVRAQLHSPRNKFLATPLQGILVRSSVFVVPWSLGLFHSLLGHCNRNTRRRSDRSSLRRPCHVSIVSWTMQIARRYWQYIVNWPAPMASFGKTHKRCSENVELAKHKPTLVSPRYVNTCIWLDRSAKEKVPWKNGVHNTTRKQSLVLR